jgi:hypothetical protein
MLQGGGNKPGVTKVFIVFSKSGLRTCVISLLFQSVCNLVGSLLRLESLCVTLEFDSKTSYCTGCFLLVNPENKPVTMSHVPSSRISTG